MPFCPNCKAEYLPDKKWCADCKVQLVDDLSQVPPQTANEEQVRAAEICQVDDTAALELIESQLHAAGIPTARQPRNVIIYVPEDRLDQARQVLAGEGPAPRLFDTVGLSEMHRIRLLCSVCEKALSIDLLTEAAPSQCACGHYFELSEARPILDKYAEVVRLMADKDFDIELELPKEEPEEE